MSRNVHEHKIYISELRVIMNYIGIDLGTSAVKLLLMEGSGKILKIVSREYPICFPKPGWSEQNPYDWFTQSMDGLKELLDGTDRSLVAGISFGGQMHGLVALDDKDEVIRPGNSTERFGRTTKECDSLQSGNWEENVCSCIHTFLVVIARETPFPHPEHDG